MPDVLLNGLLIGKDLELRHFHVFLFDDVSNLAMNTFPPDRKGLVRKFIRKGVLEVLHNGPGFVLFPFEDESEVIVSIEFVATSTVFLDRD